MTRRTSLCVAAEQLLDGDGRCVHCDRPAVATIATGADPQPEPMCGHHAASFLTMAATVLAGFDREPTSEAAGS